VTTVLKAKVDQTT